MCILFSQSFVLQITVFITQRIHLPTDEEMWTRVALIYIYFHTFTHIHSYAPVYIYFCLKIGFFVSSVANSLIIGCCVKLSEDDHFNPDVAQKIIYRMLLEAVCLLLPSLLV